MANKPHTLSMSLKVKNIESVESVDDTSYAVIILGDCAMSGDGEGVPDDVAAVRLTLRQIKYHENIDLARLVPDSTINVTITPTQTSLDEYGESIGEDDSGE